MLREEPDGMDTRLIFSGKFRELVKLSPFILIFIVISFGLIYGWHSPLSPRKIHIKSSIYAWPLGCVKMKYKDRELISGKCRSENYIFKNYYLYNLPVMYNESEKKENYYRVGDQLMMIPCEKSSCRAMFVVDEAFY